MSTDALLVLRQAIPRLSAAETRVAETIIGTPSLVVELTITELAEACGTSQATVARFCQTIGYTGYREFRVAVATSTSREQAERDRFEVDDADIDPDDSVETVVAKVAYQEVQAIELTARSLDRDALEALLAGDVARGRLAGHEGRDELFTLGRVTRAIDHHVEVEAHARQRDRVVAEKSRLFAHGPGLLPEVR